MNHELQIIAIDAHPDTLPEIVEYLMSMPIFQEMIEARPDQAAEHKP